MKPRPKWMFALSLLLAVPTALCLYSFEVPENSAANTLIGALNFTDEQISGEFSCGLYEINVMISGNELRTTSPLDREGIRDDKGEVVDTFQCSVEVMSSVELTSTTQSLIQITVLDENDNVPHFRELDEVHILNITENFNIPNSLVRLQAVDDDKGLNGTVEFDITKGNEENFFYIGLPLEYNGTDPNRDELFFNRTVDYEQHQIFNLTIMACDMGARRRCFNQVLIVEIIDVNDERPCFPMSDYFFDVKENHPLGPQNSFANVTAYDRDSISSALVYSIIEGSFKPLVAAQYIDVNNETGQLYLKKAIDYEKDLVLRSLQFHLLVYEVGFGLGCDAEIQVRLLNINDVIPEIDIKTNRKEIPENKDLSDDMFITVFIAEDEDSGGVNHPIVQIYPPMDYILETPNGRLFIVKINATLDREKVEKVIINLTVYDMGTPSLPATEILVYNVSDENDNSPNFTQVEYNAIVGDSAPLQKLVTTVRANDPDFAENGSVSYTISSVNPPIARAWFDTDPLKGDIIVRGVLNYSLVQSVSIVVVASDDGTPRLNSSTVVNIDISPSVTFKPRSYQEHCSPFAKVRDASQIYLEFRTSEKSGLLFYDESVQGEPFALGIEDGRLVAIDQSNIVLHTLDVSTNNWISVLYNIDQKTLNVSYSEQHLEREHILLSSEVVRCGNPSNDKSFFVGGINVLFQFQNVSESSDFVGTIRNLVIDSVQIDLSSPIREENTVPGTLFTSEPKCEEMEAVCSGPHYTGCLDYDTESRCICVGGFNSRACSEEKNYSPIQLSSSSKLKLEVKNYSLFFDLAQRSALIGDPHTNPTASLPRKQHALNDVTGYQLVEFQFRLLRRSAGTLLYSQTGTSIHKLQIIESRSEPSSYSIEYQIGVSETDLLSSIKVHSSQPLQYELGDLYTVVINMTSTEISVSFNGTSETQDWTTSTVLPFIQYPYTEIGLGGGDDGKANFSGCVARLAVNGIEFPLNGLVESNDASIKTAGGGGSSIGTTCDLCQQEVPPCHETSQCVNHEDNVSCECPTGLVEADDGECIALNTPVQSPGGLPGTIDPTNFPLYYIIAGAVAGTVLLALLVTVVCCICCRRKKKENQKKTYHVGGDHQVPQLGSPLHRSRPNNYTDVPRQPSLNSEPSYVSRHEGSVSTTYNEHDIDEDNESNTHNMTRSKSSTSGETGFHTASERDDQRSLPRMDDSGNEKETDYSPFDSESDESQSYIGGVHSPTNMCLANTKSRGLTLQQPLSSPSLGPISTVGAPLTPKEKKFITPLRPDSRSELGEETDLDTDFSSTVFVRQTGSSRCYRGGSLKLPGRPDSGMSGQWYKSSTSSDTERERKRAEASQAYYPPSQFRSFRRPRATSASSPQHIQPVNPPRPLTPPHIQLSRSKRRTHTNSPSISPLTSYNHHNMLPSHAHIKERDTSKKSESSEMSTSVLSRSQPLKMHYPFLRQYSDAPRVPAHLAAQSYIPSYIRSYSEESSSNKGEKKFVDLGSVRTNCDPIQYWEGQTRMMATVDQVAPYPVLSESFTPFEDSAAESQQSGPEHQQFSSQGGGEGTAEALDMGLLRDCDMDSVATGTTLKGSEHESKIILFPSADCSEEYRCTSRIKKTTLGTSSGSDLAHHSCSIPPSQGTFEV